jgi:hypothetical protein
MNSDQFWKAACMTLTEIYVDRILHIFAKFGLTHEVTLRSDEKNGLADSYSVVK